LTTETKYRGTVTNVKRKRVPGSGSSYSKTTRAKACADTVCMLFTVMHAANALVCRRG